MKLTVPSASSEPTRIRPEDVPLPKIPQWQLLLLGLGVAGLLPLAGLYLIELMQIEHYQFAPLLLIGGALLIRHRWPKSAWDPETCACLAHTPQGVVVASLLSVVGVSLGLVSAWIFSPWLGYVSLIIAGAGYLWLLTGHGFRKLLAPWMLLCAGIRLPLGLDQSLIQWLQVQTSLLADAALDLLGVEHFRQGVLIELPGRMLFVEEACSGVQSLFSMLALAALWIAWERRPLVWSLLLLAGGVLGAAVMNLVRVLAIILAADLYNLDLAIEPAHTLLGIAVFCLALLWLWCCDSWLTFLFGPIVHEESDSAVGEGLIRLWNRYFSGVEPVFLEPDDLDVSPDPPQPRWRSVSSIYSGCAAFGLAFLCLVNLGSALPRLQVWSGSDSFTTQLDQLPQDALPESLLGVPLDKFEAQHRPHLSEFGERSRNWTYRDSRMFIMASVDYPFKGWHDLRTCYQNTGWMVGDWKYLPASSSQPARLEVEMTRPTGESGFLIFSLINQDGTPFEMPNAVTGARKLSDRFNQTGQESSPAASWTAQAQIFAASYLPLKPAQREQVRESFSQLQNQVTQVLQPSP